MERDEGRTGGGSAVSLRVALDVSAAARPEPTGVARYIRRLTAALAALKEDGAGEARFTLVHRLSRLKARRFFVRSPAPNFRVKLFQEPWHPFFARSTNVFHGLDARLPGAWWRGPTVVTVHDVYSALLSEEFASAEFRELKARRYRDLARRADVLIVVSETCRRDVLNTLKPDPAKVRVVYEAAGDEFYPRPPEETEQVLRRRGLSRPYFLGVGSINRRKNVLFTVRAFLRARKRCGSPAVLALVGRFGYGGEELRREIVAAGGGEAVRFLGFVPDEELAPLYSGATALLFLSLYEGFGLPLPEAFGCGCPVLAANAGSLPEIAGAGKASAVGAAGEGRDAPAPAALLADPRDEDAAAQEIERLMTDEQLREELRRRGLRRAADFSWEKTAREHWRIYREAAGRRAGRSAATVRGERSDTH